jgi:hypothetical protein
VSELKMRMLKRRKEKWTKMMRDENVMRFGWLMGRHGNVIRFGWLMGRHGNVMRFG